MARSVRAVDPKAAERFDAARFCVESGVLLFKLGPGCPVKAVPVFQHAEIGGES